MQKIQILWADDEIDLLKPHIRFLDTKGYEVTAVTNGPDALDAIGKQNFDIVFLDENMPGLTGLETLSRLKTKKPELPVVMITKSEEEYIMEEAIGSKISDYLIKPVNPNQILLSIKKILDNKRLVTEKTTLGYQQDFRNIGMAFGEKLNFADWVELYKKLVYWELELEANGDESMADVLTMQKKEANQNFSRFVEDNYIRFLRQPDENTPVMSHLLFRNKVLPLLDEPEPLFFVLIDNLRYDQWKVIQPLLRDYFRVEEEEAYLGILPTTTQYARNAIFSGLMPLDIEKRFPGLWSNDDEEGGKNNHEEELLDEQLKRLRRDIKFSYTKVTHLDGGKDLADTIPNLLKNRLNVIVYNFVDLLSHSRTEMNVIRELAEDEAAYRSITLSWFQHSPLFEALKRIAEKPVRLVITTDHGSVRVKDAVKIIGDKTTNTNLRYKQGKNLNYNPKEVFEIRNPHDAYLPKLNVSQAFVFCKETDFFAYPNNYNHYVNYYRDTFQHGGISLEEMLIPFVTLSSK